MIRVTVNGRRVDANEGETVLTLLRREGIEVPTLCHINELSPSGSCRLCVVEVDGIDNLVPSCTFPVSEGMTIHSHSPRVLDARKTIIELLLATHPDDCLYCAGARECLLKEYSGKLGIGVKRYSHSPLEAHVDNSSPGIVFDPAKCILCGKCVRVCEEIQGVSAIDFTRRGIGTRVSPPFDEKLNLTDCVQCGQCLVNCPTGAISDKSQLKRVVEAIDSPDTIVVAQYSPAVALAVSELPGLSVDREIPERITAALHTMGIDKVFDTSFAADLNILEESEELLERIKTGRNLPLLSGCASSLERFCENFYPALIPNLSTCKSPQQMMGSVIKSVYARNEGFSPESIFSFSIMPCTSKKLEAEQEKMMNHGIPDVDAVITTRELLTLIRHYGMDLSRIDPEYLDIPFSEASSSAMEIDITGGKSAALMRTIYRKVNGTEFNGHISYRKRGSGIRTASVKINEEMEIRIAVVDGLKKAHRFFNTLMHHELFHFVEISVCTGGCIQGGGQPVSRNFENRETRKKRFAALVHKNRETTPLENSTVRELYEFFLEQPGSKIAKELLHIRRSKNRCK